MRIVTLLSGGLDSTVLLWLLKKEGYEPLALSVDYGQRHIKELAAAAHIVHLAEVPHKNVRIYGATWGGSSQTDRNVPVPEGHYAEESMKTTVVPNRNMIMLALAAGWAIAEGAHKIAYAAHGGDHAIYPDCREAFVSRLAAALARSDWHPVTDIYTPFLTATKSQIVKVGTNLKAPLELTWSCYKGGDLHCGKCGTCVERREAFELAGVVDPTEYEVTV